MAKTFIHTILNFLFPQKCLGCGEENDPPAGGLLCRNCLKRIDYPTLIKYNNIFAATDYNDEIAKKAIWLLKYQKAKQLAEPLAELIYQRFLSETRFPTLVGNRVSDWLIIPIPLSKNKLKERGFNQAEEIAKHLFAKFPKETPLGSQRGFLCVKALIKIKETPSQVSIKDRKERLENLGGAFAIKDAKKIKDKNIILIDDVSTTGATINEARKMLKEAGAKRIIALVVARG